MIEVPDQPATHTAAGKSLWTMGDAEYRRAKADILAASELTRMRADDEAELARIKAKFASRKGL